MGSALIKTMEIPFYQRLDGRFDGMIRQADVYALAITMSRLDGWYMVEPNAPLPDQSIDGVMAKEILNELVREILQVERGVWTTMVYVQSFEDPWIIKVFHPRRAGCGCGVGGGIIPWRVLTRFKPTPVPAWEESLCDLPTNPIPSTAWWKKLI